MRAMIFLCPRMIEPSGGAPYVHTCGVGSNMVYMLVRARVLSARGMLFLFPRMVQPLGWCRYSMGCS